MVTVKNRINTIINYSNYLGHNISASEITNAVTVNIVSYRSYGGRAYEYIEFWIIPGENLENSDYLTKDAYMVQTHISNWGFRTFSMNLGVFRRRWW